MKFHPLGDRVVVRRIKDEVKTSGGILIPETAQEKPQEGEVIAVGPGALNDNGQRVAPEVKAGEPASLPDLPPPGMQQPYADTPPPDTTVCGFRANLKPVKAPDEVRGHLLNTLV